MTRLDKHVMAVQRKLTLGLFFEWLVWCIAVLAAGMLLAVVVTRALNAPLPLRIVGAGAGAALAIAAVAALWRRPTLHQSAVAIDQVLGLKERFSTAISVRGERDVVAQAAVRDAERTADSVILAGRFPLAAPRSLYSAASLCILAALAFWLVPPMNLFGRKTDVRKPALNPLQTDTARKVVKEAEMRVEAAAKTLGETEMVKIAKAELAKINNDIIRDPVKAENSARKLMHDLEALKKEIRNNSTMAQAQADSSLFRSMLPGTDEKGDIADVQRALARGDFDKAGQDLKNALDKFAKMSKEEQEKAAEQMKQMADALAKMAQDPRLQQKLQQQLQQMGATQAQAQQMSSLMQQAAQGNAAAQQQMQQLANQVAQQMNGGQGATQQQMQKLQQALQQAQAQCNTQQGASQMAAGAQQMAAGMQQQVAQGGQPNPANPQAGQGQQQTAQGQQQMQGALQQMQAGQAGAQGLAGLQQMLGGGVPDGQGGQPDGQGGQGGGQAGNPDGGGQWDQGDPNAQGNPGGQGGPGIGAGQKTGSESAPFSFKTERSPSQHNEKGRIIASQLVKDPKMQVGKSQIEPAKVQAAMKSNATDEVDSFRADRKSQEVLKRYMKTMSDTEPAPAPAPPK